MVSVPITFTSLNKSTVEDYIERFRDLEVRRVFIYGLGSLHLPSSLIYTRREDCKYAVDRFKEAGFEVGFWVDSFGHGRPLFSCYDDRASDMEFTPMLSLDGESSPYALCPDGENFSRAFMKGVREMATLSPDLIMLDDDFRFARFGLQYLTCFCDNHIKDYYRRIGERVPREKISELIFSGGKNKYREAYFDMISDTLLRFARKIRETVDSVNPSIRVGASSVRETVDFSGTSQAEIARALAGGTKPFCRLSGAPYGGTDVIECVEFIRLQLSSLDGEEIECMTEGDTYPRPRYNKPSKVLELYNLALSADPLCKDRLDYLYDYTQPPSYEMGYDERARRLAPVLSAIRAAFEGTRRTGVYIYNKLHKIREMRFSSPVEKAVVKTLHMTSENPASIYMAKNSISTAFCDTGYPLCIFGENARDVDLSLMSRGAVLDARAAEILRDRGVDTGFISGEYTMPIGELYRGSEFPVCDVASGGEMAVKVNPTAEILSTFLPSGTPASYSYTNASGERFLVFATDTYLKRSKNNFSVSYYREAQILEWIEQGGKRLPATCQGHPNLYVSAAEGDGELAVLLVNSFEDEIFSPTVILDRKYSHIESPYNDARLDGDKVRLGDIGPFGFALFTVK